MANSDRRRERDSVPSNTASHETGRSTAQIGGISSRKLRQSDSSRKMPFDGAFTKLNTEAELAQLPTWQLVSAITKSSQTLGRYTSDKREVSSHCPLAEVDPGIARIVLKHRLERQWEYMHKLKCRMSLEQWKADFSIPASVNEAYERSLHELRQGREANMSKYLFLGPREPDAAMHSVSYSSPANASIHTIDVTSDDLDTGNILVVDPSLETLCEVGSYLNVEPAVFMEHLRPGSSADGACSVCLCRLHCWAVHRLDATEDVRTRVREILMDRPSGIDAAVLAEALVRVSCHRLRGSLFLTLVKTPKKPLNERPSLDLKCAAIPVESSLTGPWSDWIQSFFAENWNTERFADLWATSLPSTSVGTGVLDEHDRSLLAAQEAAHARGRVFEWLLALHSFETKVVHLALEFRALDYELINMQSNKALSQIKKRRAQVARLRQDIAEVNRYVRGYYLNAYYEGCRGTFTRDRQARQNNWTERQMAGASVQEEYDWIDGRAADSMPLLNQNLQLVTAQISLEQTAIAVKQAAIALQDTKISRRNGERTTLLTLLMAIYLPLSLATGIFGMNIQEIAGDSPPRWWAFIAIASALTALSVCFIWFFFTRGNVVGRPWEHRMHRLTRGWWGIRAEYDEEAGMIDQGLR